jgi:hypothetical protein
MAFTRLPVMVVNSSSCGSFILVSGPMISCTSPPEQKFDRLPHEGDSVVVEGYTATVLDMQGHRVAQVRIAKSGEPSESADGGEA